MKTLSLSLLALLAAAPALAQVEGTLRFTVAEYSSATGPYFEDLATQFEAANPGTDIQIEVVPWDVLLQKLTTDISAGVNADMAIIGTRWLIDFVNEGLAAPASDVVSQEVLDRFVPALLEPGTLEGTLYGLPVAASARALYVNDALLSQAGAAAPATWDEVRTAAQAVVDGTDAAGFGLQGNEIETDVYFYYALWSFGGDIIEADGTSGLDSPAAIEAATLYKEMIDAGLTQEGATAMSREDVQNLFKQGGVSMVITAPFLANQIAAEVPDLDYSVHPVPAGPTGANFTYGVTDSIVVFENSQNKELAGAFLDFAFQPEARARFTSGEGFLPVTTAEAALPEFADDPTLQVFTGLMANARFAPTIPGWEEIAQITSDALQRVYLGEETPEAALTAAAAEIDGILQSNQ